MFAALEAIQSCRPKCVFICSGQMVADWPVLMTSLWSVLLISGYSEKASLYSAEQGHTHTEGATVAHRGQTALRVYSSVCDRSPRTGITTKHIHVWTHTSKLIACDALTGAHNHIITLADQKTKQMHEKLMNFQLSGSKSSFECAVWVWTPCFMFYFSVPAVRQLNKL